MKFSRFLIFRRLLLRLFICAVAIGAADAPYGMAAAPHGSQAPAILPQEFGGWQRQGAPQPAEDASVADPTNGPILKEYGFTDLEAASYTRDDGRTLKIRAARFGDASGAFGAYTFYLQPAMTKEQIGDQGASLGQRVLFYRGHILIDALFSKESPMAGAELRELAGALPRPPGNAGTLPPVLAFMPHHGYVTNTEKYAMGPLALAALAPPLPVSLVDFNVSPEVSLGRYSTPSGEATLMLIYYPTPQLAAVHLRQIDASQQVPQPVNGVSTTENSGHFSSKRTGPIVAIASGALSESDAKMLLGAVNYEASVTWNENTYFDKNNNIGALLVNIILLCFILGAMAIVAGVAFGGLRILMKRFFPDRIFDRPEQVEFISLRLTEAVVRGRSASGPISGGGDIEDPS